MWKETQQAKLEKKIDDTKTFSEINLKKQMKTNVKSTEKAINSEFGEFLDD